MVNPSRYTRVVDNAVKSFEGTISWSNALIGPRAMTQGYGVLWDFMDRGPEKAREVSQTDKVSAAKARDVRMREVMFSGETIYSYSVQNNFRRNVN